ncbi:MAG: hypothetical protein L6R42_000274 [Xanthoria sp. 1 TBL-2021]|nr:MAG: hypothetical protein L6R42_000274 [Xanthoria sp. 1 TBL-2021]
MEHEFETMDTLAFRQDDISTLTESLEATAKGLEDVNRRVNASVIQLKKALKKHFAQVNNGERASSIMSTVSSSSGTTTTSQSQWRLIREELESVGITAAQLNANRDMVVGILRSAFQEEAAKDRSIEIITSGQLTPPLFTLSNSSKTLLAAAEEGGGGAGV